MTTFGRGIALREAPLKSGRCEYLLLVDRNAVGLVQHLTSNQLDSFARVTICTIQRLYSILRGEELEEDLDEKSGTW